MPGLCELPFLALDRGRGPCFGVDGRKFVAVGKKFVYGIKVPHEYH